LWIIRDEVYLWDVLPPDTSDLRVSSAFVQSPDWLVPFHPIIGNLCCNSAALARLESDESMGDMLQDFLCWECSGAIRLE
jgi:hypothetical protein